MGNGSKVFAERYSGKYQPRALFFDNDMDVLNRVRGKYNEYSEIFDGAGQFHRLKSKGTNYNNTRE